MRTENGTALTLSRAGSKNSSALYDATCKHGDIECRGNIQQLCAADLWETPSSGHGGNRKHQAGPDASGDVNVSLKGNQAWEDWWNVRKACFHSPSRFFWLTKLEVIAPVRPVSELRRAFSHRNRQRCERLRQSRRS